VVHCLTEYLRNSCWRYKFAQECCKRHCNPYSEPGVLATGCL